MNDKLKRIFKKSITPTFLTLLYITAVAVLAYFADKETNGGLLDFDYATSFVIFLILTGPAFLMAISGLFWVVEFVKYKEYKYENKTFAITSVICGTLFLIGVFTFFFFTLGIF
jgi:hypothetical protein